MQHASGKAIKVPRKLCILSDSVLKLDLAREVKKGCADEDLVGLTFNTIGVR